MTPYVYRIKSKQGHFYYGCRYAQGCDPTDFWSTYFTSSKPVRSLIEEHGKDFFEPKIVKVCRTQEEALRIERTLISRSHQLPGCLNQFLCRKDGTAVHFGTFGPPSEETREKIRQALLGHKNSDEAKELMRQRKLGTTWGQSHRDGIAKYKETPKYAEVRQKIKKTSQTRKKTPEELAAISAKLTGIKRSDETRRRMAEGVRSAQQAIPLYMRPRALPLKDKWAMAGQCYAFWLAKKGSYYTFCVNHNGGENISVFRSMYKMFDNGWVPSEDTEFLEYTLSLPDRFILLIASS